MTSTFRKGGTFLGEAITTLLIGYTPIQSILVLKIKNKIKKYSHMKKEKVGNLDTDTLREDLM